MIDPNNYQPISVLPIVPIVFEITLKSVALKSAQETITFFLHIEWVLQLNEMPWLPESHIYVDFTSEKVNERNKSYNDLHHLSVVVDLKSLMRI